MILPLLTSAFIAGIIALSGNLNGAPVAAALVIIVTIGTQETRGR